jgi:hypothetical protein
LEGRYDDKKKSSSGLRKIDDEEIEEWLNEWCWLCGLRKALNYTIY